MPIHIAVGVGAWKIYRIKFSLIRPLKVIRRTAMRKLITVQGVGLIKRFLQFGYDHFMESPSFGSPTARLRTPIHRICGYEQELGMILVIINGGTIPEKSNIHTARRADERTQKFAIGVKDGGFK